METPKRPHYIPDCRKCFGHGTDHHIDPICRFGCGIGKKEIPISHDKQSPTLVPHTKSKLNHRTHKRATEYDQAFIRKMHMQVKKGITWFAVVTVATTVLSTAFILTCLYKRKTNRVDPIIRNIGRGKLS